MGRVLYTTPGLKNLNFFYADGTMGSIEGGYIVVEDEEEVRRLDEALSQMARSSRGMVRRIDEDEEAEAVQEAIAAAQVATTPQAVQGPMTTLTSPTADPQHAEDRKKLQEGTADNLATALKQAAE